MFFRNPNLAWGLAESSDEKPIAGDIQAAQTSHLPWGDSSARLHRSFNRLCCRPRITLGLTYLHDTQTTSKKFFQATVLATRPKSGRHWSFLVNVSSPRSRFGLVSHHLIVVVL